MRTRLFSELLLLFANDLQVGDGVALDRPLCPCRSAGREEDVFQIKRRTSSNLFDAAVEDGAGRLLESDLDGHAREVGHAGGGVVIERCGCRWYVVNSDGIVMLDKAPVRVSVCAIRDGMADVEVWCGVSFGGRSMVVREQARLGRRWPRKIVPEAFAARTSAASPYRDKHDVHLHIRRRLQDS